MKAIVFDRFGPPEEVLQVREVPMPEPARGQVRIRMVETPINPSDLMTVRGIYGRLPSLPATPGFEGVGVIDRVGGGLFARIRGLRPGRRVAVLNSQGGNWQEFVVIPARQAVPIPDDLPNDQAASFFVNPATAWIMTQKVLQVPRGEWLVQTAAASALGKMVIRLGKHLGFHTLNVVRRQEHADELIRLGADAVVVYPGQTAESRAKELTQGRGIRFALDPVGGAMGLDAVKALGAGGRMLVYGTLSGDPIPLDPRLLMVGQKRIEGFWLSEWVKDKGPLAMLKLFKQITTLLRQGILTTPVQATFSLDQIREAVKLAETPGRTGKILLKV